MILSQTSRYALRAVVFLAQQDPDGKVRSETIADALGVPRNYLSKILHELARAGLLESTRGPTGGFTLAVPPAEVTLDEVIERYEGWDRQRQCLLGRPECGRGEPCAAHETWSTVIETVRGFFRATTVEDLARKGSGAEVPV